MYGNSQIVREGTAERDYFRGLFKTKAFKYILGPDFDSSPTTRFAKPMALSIFESVLHPNFDPATRERCLKASGEVCCQVFLKHAGLNGDTDIKSFMRSLEDASAGGRWLTKKGNLLFDEIRWPDGKCTCPVVRGTDLEQPILMCRVCCRHSREVLFGSVAGRAVRAEPLDTPLCTGSDSCRWVIYL